MNKLILTLSLLMASLNPVFSFAGEVKANSDVHSVIVNNLDGKSHVFTLKKNEIVENGSYEPGLYMSPHSSEALVYDQKLKWIKRPHSKELEKWAEENVVLRDSKALPIRIKLSGLNREASATFLADLMKRTPDSLELKIDAKKGQKTFKEMTSTVATLGNQEENELAFQQMVLEVPESAVSIKNLRTGETMSLENYIDKNYDRSFTSVFKSLFIKKIANDAPVSDTSRGMLKKDESSVNQNKPSGSSGISK